MEGGDQARDSQVGVGAGVAEAQFEAGARAALRGTRSIALRLSRPQSISQGARVSRPKRLYELMVGLSSAVSAGACASRPPMACRAVADRPYW